MGRKGMIHPYMRSRHHTLVIDGACRVSTVNLAVQESVECCGEDGVAIECIDCGAYSFNG